MASLHRSRDHCAIYPVCITHPPFAAQGFRRKCRLSITAGLLQRSRESATFRLHAQIFCCEKPIISEIPIENFITFRQGIGSACRMPGDDTLRGRRNLQCSDLARRSATRATHNAGAFFIWASSKAWRRPWHYYQHGQPPLDSDAGTACLEGALAFCKRSIHIQGRGIRWSAAVGPRRSFESCVPSSAGAFIARRRQGGGTRHALASEGPDG